LAILPFGHAGQDALNECMQGHGGFEHNLQSLRIVDRLEERYGAFDGLNLMFETREGILKHCSPARARELGDLGRRFLEDRRPSLEAQICNLADEIAYNNHDVDDGLRSGVLTLEQLQEVSLFARHAAEVDAEFPRIAGRRRVHETIRRMIDAQVTDLLAESARRIAAGGAGQPRRRASRAGPDRFHRGDEGGEPRAEGLSCASIFTGIIEVLRMTAKARRVIQDLFAAFVADPRLLPPQYQAMAARGGMERATADYIAGMTDRYSMKEHRRLFAVSEF
jgi:dGTPase